MTSIVSVNILTLPNDGGSAITDLEYRVNAGAAISLGETTTGSYPITADEGDDIQIRAVNTVGAGDWSDVKAVPADSEFDNLLSTLSTGAAQLIAHPLEYGSMFQDRAGTTPVTESGQLVGRVLDAGGGDYHAEAISDAARGIFRDVGGFRYIEYNGVNTAYQTTVLPAPEVDKFQAFGGLHRLTDSDGQQMVQSGREGNGYFQLLAKGGSGETFRVRSRGTTDRDLPSNIVDTKVIISALGDIGAPNLILRINDVELQNTSSQGSGDYTSRPLTYGARTDGDAGFFNGFHYATLGPIVRFGTNATAEQIEAAEAYYTARTDL